MSTLTFIDSGVLIAAARGQGDISSRALAILDDPDREFASSPFVRLELLPKALFNKRTKEAEFYAAFFESVSRWADDLEAITTDAYREATTYGLAAMDALHVAAATYVEAAELVTSEQLTKPIHRTRSCRVVSINPDPCDQK